jgi:hypothetical protein
MAVILGNGAFRIWVGKDKKTGKSNNIGIRIQEKKFPSQVNLDRTVQVLADKIEQLIHKECSWL